MKKRLSNTWLIIKFGVEKYLTKNFKMFVPSSAGSSILLGKHTAISINLIFPLLEKLMQVMSIKTNIYSAVSFCKKNKTIEESIKLKKLFDFYGSDKSTMHNYHLVYASLFQKKKDSIQKVLEIGLGTNNTNILSNMGPKGKPGASVRAFRDYFTKAKIFGADIDSEILFSEKRIKTYKVDQCSIDSMEKLFKKKIGKNFDLIIDDGLHAPYTNINFILACLNKVKKDGWLIIEDIPFKTKPIWSIISLILSKNEKCFLVKTKNCYVFCINKKG